MKFLTRSPPDNVEMQAALWHADSTLSGAGQVGIWLKHVGSLISLLKQV